MKSHRIRTGVAYFSLTVATAAAPSSCSLQTYGESQSAFPKGDGGSVVETGNTHSTVGGDSRKKGGSLSLAFVAKGPLDDADHLIIHAQALIAVPSTGSTVTADRTPVRVAFAAKRTIDLLASQPTVLTSPFPDGTYAEVGVEVASAAELVLKSGVTVPVYVVSEPSLPASSVPANSSILLARRSVAVSESTAQASPLLISWSPALALKALEAPKLEPDGQKYLEELALPTASLDSGTSLSYVGAVPGKPFANFALPSTRMSLTDDSVILETPIDISALPLQDFLKGDQSNKVNVVTRLATPPSNAVYSASAEGRTVAVRVGGQVLLATNWNIGTPTAPTVSVPLAPYFPSSYDAGTVSGTPVSVSLSNGALFLFFLVPHELLWWNDALSAGSKPPDGRLEKFDYLTNGFTPRVILVGKRFLILDTTNSRILIWNQIPSSSSTPPDVVLGQVDATAHAPNQGQDIPSASSLSFPEAFDCDGERLVVSDSSNNRILVWNHVPIATNAPADAVIGPADFTTRGANQVLQQPTSIFLKNGVIYVQTSDGLARSISPVQQ